MVLKFLRDLMEVDSADMQRQYPEVVEKFLNKWLGFSDDSTIYGTSQDTIINFSADIEKQDAVVRAFKVRPFSFPPFSHS